MDYHGDSGVDWFGDFEDSLAFGMLVQMVVMVFLLLGLSLILGLSVLALWYWRGRHRSECAEWGVGWLNLLDALNRVFCRSVHGLPQIELNLPPQGAALLVANHVSGLDPVLMAALAQRPVRFMIAQEEYDRWWLRWFFRRIGCIPVARSTRPEVALRAALRTLRSGEVVGLFPQGGFVLPDTPSKPLRRGVFWLAKQADCPIYPLHLSGIRGMGHTVSAVWMPSHVQVKVFPALRCHDDERACLPRLQQLLEDSAGCSTKT